VEEARHKKKKKRERQTSLGGNVELSGRCLLNQGKKREKKAGP